MLSYLPFFLQRALFALCFVFLAGCSSTKCRMWEFNEIRTKVPRFNAGRLLLAPDSTTSYLELEITKNQSGVRLYINILFFEAPPCPDLPLRTKVDILFEDQEKWSLYPYLFAGGQRLLFPNDSADLLIQALLDGRTFKVQMGRSSLTVIPDNFPELYSRLILLPIEEVVENN